MKIINQKYHYIPLNLIFIIFLFITIQLFGAKVDAKETNNQDKIQLSIVKSYSSKFCNAIGIGMSTDSALQLSMRENSNPKFNPSLWLEITLNGNNKINNIDTNILTEKVFSQIIEDCGQAINIKESIANEEFKSKIALGLKSNIEK